MVPVHLDCLMISECSLTKIDPLLHEKELRELDVSFSRGLGSGLNLTHLPYKLKHLTAVGCGLKRISSVKHDLAGGSSVHLNFREHCPVLEHLDLSMNEDIECLDIFFAPDSLRSLHMRSCSLFTIYSSLKHSKLLELDISVNPKLGKGYQAKNLPATLKKLSAANCGINTAGSHAHLFNLQHLDWSDNGYCTRSQLGIGHSVSLICVTSR